MMPLLDRYQIQARIAPTLIVFLPLVLATLFALLGLFGPLPLSLFGFGMIAVAALAVLYALSFWVQHLGKEREGELWTGWGGAPTTRVLRWRDRTLAEGKKRRIRDKAQQISGVTLLSEEEEKIGQVLRDGVGGSQA